jgi:dipeptidyl aminopeptidase/acylaminoacyl peptidase
MKARKSRLYLIIVAAVMASVLTLQVALAAFIKLSGAMPAYSDVQDFKISPDGQYVVYRADQDTDEAFELYSVPLSGGVPVRLIGALPTGSSVSNDLDYQISPDSSRVIYRADQDTTGIIELYSVSIAGPTGASVKLNGALVTGGGVYSYQISPDNSQVVYIADQYTDDVFELHSVPLAGPASAGVKLNGSLVTFGDVSGFRISPDSSQVIYWADQQTNNVFELYSVPLTGPASAGVKLNESMVAGGDVGVIQISPDSSRVIYWADQDTDEVMELYSVPLNGPASSEVKINGSMVAGGDVLGDFQISPDSSRVVYRADQQIDNINELYSVPLSGPASSGVKLNGAMVTGGNVNYFQISPDGIRVVYIADQHTDEVYELYSVPLNGPAGAEVKLNGALVIGGSVYYFRVSPDSSRVVYRADQDTTGVNEIYSVPLNGPANAGVKLNGALVTGGDVSDYQVSPDSSQVVYRADQDTDDVSELYIVPLAGPDSEGIKLNGMLVTGGDVSDYQVSPDSCQVVYNADQDTDEIVELYKAYIYFKMYLPLVQK